MQSSLGLRAVHAWLLTAVALIAMACANSAGTSSTQPRQESGDASAATDTSGTGGTLRIAMSAGNVPIPDQFLTEGGEGGRFVGKNIYDTLLMSDAWQGDHVPVPGPGLA